jgi:hypothetical protein
MAGILKVDQVQSDSNLSFQVAGANVAYMNSTGLQMTGGTLSLAGTTIIPAVGQIKFPSTQNASADGNTLDDYEEGTFTPVWTGTSSGTVTTGANSGRYVKVGSLVTIWVSFVNPSATTMSGDWRISLPFTVSSFSAYITGSVGYARYIPTIAGCSQLTVWTSNGYTYCHVARNSETTGETTNQSGNVSADSLLGYSLTYTSA